MKIFELIFIVSISVLIATGFFTFIIADNLFRQKDWYFTYKKIVEQVLRWGAVIALASAAIAIALIKI